MQIDLPKNKKERVVILGGGFGGLSAAAKLSSEHYQTVLIDKNNFHTFQPLLYQVAAAGLEPDSICSPIRKILSYKKDFHFRMATVEGADIEKKIVFTNQGSLSYDHLIIAMGAETNFLGNSDLQKNAFPLKEMTDATTLRNHIFMCFESALYEKGSSKKQSLLNFVIVGGGPTGVELAGALAELKRHILPKDYPDLSTDRVSISLIESTERLLNAMSVKSGEVSLEYLKKMGVIVFLNTCVQQYDGKLLTTKDGMTIPTSTVIWAAGVNPRTIPGLNDVIMYKGRIEVDCFNRILLRAGKVSSNVYALGDICCMRTSKYEQGLPGMASAAIQQGKHIAENLNRIKKNQKPIEFKFRDKGVMATVGRNLAVAEIAGKTATGMLGWFLWMAVHLWYLVGFRNKAVVFVNWVISYLTYDRGVRIITPQKSKES